jgi:hypothetical protein
MNSYQFKKFALFHFHRFSFEIRLFLVSSDIKVAENIINQVIATSLNRTGWTVVPLELYGQQ